jgi:UDP-N-acetylmuramoylalanine--D-glutamate ligase
LGACTICGLVGVSPGTMRETIRTFAGVEHRLELVREIGGVRYYDDSIATAPERVVAALRSFDEPIVLLAGGRDKDLPWEAFTAETLSRVRCLITFGEAGGMIARTVEKQGRAAQNGRMLEGIIQVDTLEEAVVAAAREARSGEVVLLSPGGTSFDAFTDFAERGDRFKELVGALEN